MTLDATRIQLLKARYVAHDFTRESEEGDDLLAALVDTLTVSQMIAWRGRYCGITRERERPGAPWGDVHGPRMSVAEVCDMLDCDEHRVWMLISRAARKLLAVR